jgi:hypothetical protein
VATTSIDAYNVFCARQGERESEKQQHNRRLYMFALQACSPGASWRWRFTNGWRNVPYRGAFSINDACRFFGDMNTSWRPRVTEMYQDGWLIRLPEKRRDPITGRNVHVHVPTQVVITPRRRPQPAKLLRTAIPQARELLQELDPEDEWTQRMSAILYSFDMQAVIPPPSPSPRRRQRR